MSVEVRGIRESELADCLELWHTVFAEDPPGYFERYFYGDADFQPEYTRVAIVDGRIASAVHIVKRTVACSGFTLTMGGIANVATHPDVRGRGCASECLRQAVEVMEADAMDFSTLGTGIHGFYARLGWEPITSHYLAGPICPDLSATSEWPDLPDSVRIRPYLPGDAVSIQAIYEEFNRDRPITVRRTPPYWRDWVRLTDDHPRGRMLVADAGGRPVSYCSFWTHETTLAILELGVYDATKDVLPLLIRVCAAWGLGQGAQRLELRVPATPEVRRAAEVVLASPVWAEQRGEMVRFFDIERLLRGILPNLSERWQMAGAMPGALTFTGPGGTVRIGAGERGLCLDSVDSAESYVLSQADLFGLLLGGGLAEGRAGKEDRRFADSLFPCADGWYWDLDGF